MSDPKPEVPSVGAFLQNQAGPRFVALVDDLERRLAQVQKELDDIRAAEGTFCWHVEGSPPAYFNFSGGKAAVEETPAREPVMTVRLSAPDWERLVTGQVAGGFLDGGGRSGFGKSRLDRLAPLRGTVRFTLTGLASGDDWSVDVGLNGPPEAPKATISMPADVAADIQAGKVNPQMAFMQGKVKMQGDAGLVMQFGMAMFA